VIENTFHSLNCTEETKGRTMMIPGQKPPLDEDAEDEHAAHTDTGDGEPQA